jgi:hypothetical protein
VDGVALVVRLCLIFGWGWVHADVDGGGYQAHTPVLSAPPGAGRNMFCSVAHDIRRREVPFPENREHWPSPSHKVIVPVHGASRGHSPHGRHGGDVLNEVSHTSNRMILRGVGCTRRQDGGVDIDW